VNWIQLALESDQWQPPMNTIMNLRVQRKVENFLVNYLLAKEFDSISSVARRKED
jgi:hypothetical protein